jgi:hypothetical protein
MAWKHPSSPLAQKVKTMPSAQKTKANVFWDHKGVLIVDFLDCDTTGPTEHYCGTLERLRQATVTNGMTSYAKVTLFCMATSVSLLPIRLVLHYGLTADRLEATLQTGPFLFPVNLISWT